MDLIALDWLLEELLLEVDTVEDDEVVLCSSSEDLPRELLCSLSLFLDLTFDPLAEVELDWLDDASEL